VELLLVVLTRAAVTQLAAAAPQQQTVAQLALAAILTFGQKRTEIGKDVFSQLPHFLFMNI
jgi:hypothetical protein